MKVNRTYTCSVMLKEAIELKNYIEIANIRKLTCVACQGKDNCKVHLASFDVVKEEQSNKPY